MTSAAWWIGCGRVGWVGSHVLDVCEGLPPGLGLVAKRVRRPISQRTDPFINSNAKMASFWGIYKTHPFCFFFNFLPFGFFLFSKTHIFLSLPNQEHPAVFFIYPKTDHRLLCLRRAGPSPTVVGGTKNPRNEPKAPKMTFSPR